ncbi:MAG: ZIP family metal transporter [Dehalococcoidia bacterium]
MPEQAVLVIAISGAAAIASVAGGLIAIVRPPGTLLASLALGFASGVLFTAIAFEMLPESLELGNVVIAAAGFTAGLALIYGFDLFVHRGKIAGDRAEQVTAVKRLHNQHPPRGGEVTVLAGGTSIEEVVEGLSIGVGMAIEPNVGMVIALAVVINNLSEGMSIGELARIEAEHHQGTPVLRVLKWTGLIGASVFLSALAGWFLFRGMPEEVLGFLFAFGAGGMLYLTVTDLIPEAERRHYQQSAAIALALGFLVVLVLTEAV